MAMINILRKRMGKIVVGFVAFSMFAFILTDLFQSNSTLLGGNDQTIATISGDDIKYPEFTQELDRLTYNFAINNNGRNPSSQELQSIREQVWNSLVLRYAYEKEYGKLGLEVSDLEVVDMVQGNNIDPQLQQLFRDPNTGEFSRESVVQFLQSLNDAPPAQRASWLSFEEQLKPNRIIRKYESLLEKTNYVTKAEAKSFYKSQNSNVSVDYLYIPYFSVADSQFVISDSELRTYLNDNPEEFKREESRSLSYVSLPIVPSQEDTAFVTEEINSLIDGLRNAQNDSIYAAINSDGDNPYQSISDLSLLPEAFVNGDKVTASVGDISEPELDNNAYSVQKLSAITSGEEYFVRARHILVRVDDTSTSAKDAARKEAEGLLRQLRRGVDFSELAAQNSDDASNANNGGDLGWFGENGSFVQPFKDAVFAHNGTGLLREPVETSFGYHIIRIDQPKTNKVYKLATIEKEFFASDQTLNEIYRQADLLSANSSDLSSLTENASSDGLTVRTASNLRKNDSRVGTLQEARQIVAWLYRDAGVNDVSDVFELDDTYVVAVMTEEQEEGTANLDQVRNEVRNKVMNQKKADYIVEKLKSAESQDIESMKVAYGDGARDGSADLTLSSNSFPNVGFAPEAVGVAFSLQEGESTQPFSIDNGVIVMTATAKSTPDELEDYNTYILQVQSQRQVRKNVVANFPLSFSPIFVSSRIDDAVKENADIEDKRYKFF